MWKKWRVTGCFEIAVGTLPILISRVHSMIAEVFFLFILCMKVETIWNYRRLVEKTFYIFNFLKSTRLLLPLEDNANMFLKSSQIFKDFHKSLYQSCEIHDPWVRSPDPRVRLIWPYTWSKVCEMFRNLPHYSHVYLLKSKYMVIMFMKST